MARLLGCAVAGLGLGAAARPALAQISPGRLSRGHAALEGSTRCLDCHEPRQGAAPAKCLACHAALAGGRGLHARPEYRDCQRCHVEHQGDGADLVWWGRAGRAAFDHALTGHALAGRHATLACESCHQQRLVRDPERLRAGGANPARTFLGLRTECASCHADPHRGTRLSARPCASCHGQQSWKAPAFDHARTAFPLAGAHAPAPCASCHALRAGEAPRRGDAGGAAARQCASCHPDPHQGRLGASCAGCHSVAGWRRLVAKGFDHARTGYPLEGRHGAVACDACHGGGRPARPRRSACSDCHSDVHLGQLTAAGAPAACEACHDVNGFSPSRYALERHQGGRFPLQGAHLAVACDRCHRRLPAAELARLVPALAPAAARGAGATAQFRFAGTSCRDCHGDPHRGELARGAQAGECTACHDVQSWRTRFDHGRTRFALTGPHARAACEKCHAPVAAGTRGARLKLGGLDTACQSCHRDPHQGQFARAAGTRACPSCHGGPELRAVGFDHGRDSGFALAGAHARAACAACHRRERRDAAEFTRYRPVPTACSACHAGGQVAEAAP